MKKLILVTMLAVAATWLLSGSEDRPDDGIAPLDIARHEHKAKRVPGGLIVLDDGQTLPAPVRPALPPEPPSPPETIRTIPWRPVRERPDPPTRKATLGKQSPSWFPKTEADEEAKAKADAFGSRVLLGRLSASEDRARQDLRKIVEREVASWLAADVPPSWKVPTPVFDGMVQGSYTQEVTKSLVPSAETSTKPEEPGIDGLYTLHRSGQKLDFSPARRAEIVGIYRRDIAAGRMQRLGGGLALALVGLAVLSGYIKADEATKGYYTNRLRLAAAAGLGAAGVAAYRFLV
jgi:hypothetical protein